MSETPTDPVYATPDGLPRLLEVMRRLRAPDGCPWDREQDFATIAPYTIEEAYEVADAIERQDWSELRFELGDLLLQIVYHAQIAAERGLFDFNDVAAAVAGKMIDRHPHVFGNEAADKSADQQKADWETRKAAERAARARSGVLDDVASNLPALIRAEKLQKRAARVGFDWDNADDVLDKLSEECGELAAARFDRDPDAMEDEFGDILFAVVNVGRHLKIDPEQALRRTNAKFTRRFAAIEAALAAQNRRPEDATLAEMDALWQAAKEEERTRQ